MKKLTLDFETFYNDQYSLRKMTPAEYILDQQFECTGLAVKHGSAPAYWVEGDEAQEFFDQQSTDVMCLSHNALFDMCICAWRYGWVPRVMVDTMGISRALFQAYLRSVSLDSVDKYLGGVGKDKAALTNVKNMRLNQIRQYPDLYNRFRTYGAEDANKCWNIFEETVLAGKFPASEIAVMDMVLRCCVLPQFHIDQSLLMDSLSDIQMKKEQALAKAMLFGADDKSALMSNDKFALLLEELGVVPPRKISGTTGKETWAFAKSDQDFLDLVEHPDPSVQAVMAARLGHKSTIEESRHERFISISNLTWPDNAVTSGGNMPMPLRYGAAHTHRLGGDWKINCMHPDVEVLTPEGWQRVEDWQPETPVMQWWPDGTMTWDVSAKKVEQYKDKLVWFDAPFVKGGFTTDHRMVRISKYTGVAKEILAKDFVGKDTNNIPVSGIFSGAGTMTCNQARIMVALAADGSCLYSGDTRQSGYRPQKKTRGWRFGFTKQRKVDRLRMLLDNESVIYNYWSDGIIHQITIREANTPDWMVKGYGKWVLDLNPYAADALLSELVHWDGFKNSRSGNTTFCTSLKDQAEWVQTLAHLREQPATLRKYQKLTSYGNSIQFYVYFRSGKTSAVSKKQSCVKPYGGNVYCPQVESTYVIVRYGQGVFITGNCQNLGRGSKLRQSLVAPDGYVVVAGDESQVEARFVCTLCRQEDMRQQFERGEDVYSHQASRIFGFTVSKANKVERFIGKQCILGLGFGLGAEKYTRSIPILAKNQLGVDLPYTPQEGKRDVSVYRTSNTAIVQTWKTLNTIGIQALLGGREWQWGPVVFRKHRIDLPNGMSLFYHNLRQVNGGKFGTEWVFDYGGAIKRIYGGKLLENVVQALARIVVMEAALRVQKHLARLGIKLALQVHDELVFVVRKEYEAIVRMVLTHELRRRPDWLPNLPLDCEVGSGPSYGDAK